MASKESSIEYSFRIKCLKNGWDCIKIVDVKGFPDRMVLFGDGRVAFVELKNEVGKLSKIQEHMHGHLRAGSYPVYVLHSTDEVNQWIISQGGRV